MLGIFRVFILLLIFFTTSSSYADIIYLNNGDRISGKITTMVKSELKLVTAYSEITIPWTDIINISANESITVKLTDGSQFTGNIIETKQGLGIKTSSLAKPVPLGLANINAINPPPIPLDTIITGDIHLGGSKASGNTDNQALHADTEIIVTSDKNKFSAGVKYNQAANDGTESENNLHLFSQYDYYFLPKWYASLFTNYTKDRFQGLNSRTAFGAGIGHELWDTKHSFLSAEAGAAYTVEDHDEGTDREFIAGRWAVDYQYWVLQDRLQFFHDHEGIISYEDLSDVLVKSHTGVKLPIFEGFKLLAQFDIDYDTKPAEDKKNTDTRYIIGAGYSW